MPRVAISEETVQKGPWLQSPVRRGIATGKDKAAREELLKLVEGRQDDDFRQNFKVVIPDDPSGLPRDYDLLLYGKFLDWSMLRVEIKVRNGKAVMELATPKQMRRGEISKDQIDAIARQLVYAHLADHKPRDEREFSSVAFSSISTHTPEMQFEIISREESEPFHLHTPANQLTARSVNAHDGGIPGYIESRCETQLLTIADKKLPTVKPTDDVVHDLVCRLKAISDDKIEKEGFAYAGRDDLPAVEALLYSKLAVTWLAKDALPELRRLKVVDYVQQLEIATKDDPTPELKQCIRGKYWPTFRWAMQFTTIPPNSKYYDLLISSLPHVAEDRVEIILESLAQAEITPAQLSLVESFRAEATLGTRRRIVATRFLLDRTHNDALYAELGELAREPRTKTEFSSPAWKAMENVLFYSVNTGRKRQESAALARVLIGKVPDGDDFLLRQLGQLGDSNDLPRLKSFCREDNDYITALAINAIAHINPSEGLTLALEQIDSHNKNEQDPRWRVQEYLELLFWRRDPAAIKPLEASLAKSLAHDSEDSNWIPQLEQVIYYMKSSDVKERLAIALKFDGAHIDQSWRADIGRQLIANGADAQACQVFLKPLPKPNWRLR